MAAAPEKKLLTREDTRTLGLSSLGGALEFYDFVIYVFYAKIISELFFPSTLSPFWAMLNTYGIFAAGYLFRPLGGMVMAHFGDLVGRKRLFALSIMMMAVPTLIIGLLPTFHTIGYVAPLLLLLMRVIQGVAIGGEIPAAWTFVSEHVPDRHIGLANGFLTAGLSLGILLGSLMALSIAKIYTPDVIHDWAWRIPFIIGGVFGLITMYLRSYLKETPVFKAMQERKQLSEVMPIKLLVSQHKTGIVLGMLFTWFLTGCIVVLILAMPQLLTSTFAFDSVLAFEMQSLAIVTQMLGCIVFGVLSDKVGCGRMLGIGALLVAVMSVVFYTSLAHQSTQTVFALYMLLGLVSGTVGIVAVAMVRMFPPQVRFTGISFAYNVSYAIVGGLTLPFVHWLNSVVSPIGAVYYVVPLALMACVTAFMFHRRYRV